MPISNFYGDRPSVNVTTSKTLAATDAGTIQNVTADAQVITLPAAAAGLVGLSFTIAVGGNNGDNTVTVTPNAADGVNGLGFTSTVAKGPQSLKATGKAGDRITLTCSGVTGVNAWYIADNSGLWTRLP